MNVIPDTTLSVASAPPFQDDDPLYEIIDGQRVKLPPMSILANRVASRLMGKLGWFLETNPLGEALMETLLHLPLPADRNRRPDLAFVSAERIAKAPPQPGSDNAWDVMPELMIEVVSPNDLVEELMEKLEEYWSAGARLVWVIYPTQKRVYVYESPRKVRILTEADELDGGAVLPGLRVPIASLFPA